MPEHDHLPPKVAAQQDGEGVINEVIREQATTLRTKRRRDLPREFLERVYRAQEYSLRHQGLDEDECCQRRRRLNGWLDQLRQDDNYDKWLEQIRSCRAVLRELTPEERAAEEAKKTTNAAAKKAADARAEALLRENLSTKQLKELVRRNYFHVVVGERRFRITRGRSHNVKEVDRWGRVFRTLCAHPTELVPDADTMLAQKLWLETQPIEFLKIANVVRVERPREGMWVGPPTINLRDIDRLVLDRVADAVAAEAQARREEQAAEEGMRILENAARATPAGVEPVPQPEAPAVRAA